MNTKVTTDEVLNTILTTASEHPEVDVHEALWPTIIVYDKHNHPLGFYDVTRYGDGDSYSLVKYLSENLPEESEYLVMIAPGKVIAMDNKSGERGLPQKVRGILIVVVHSANEMVCSAWNYDDSIYIGSERDVVVTKPEGPLQKALSLLMHKISIEKSKSTMDEALYNEASKLISGGIDSICRSFGGD